MNPGDRVYVKLAHTDASVASMAHSGTAHPHQPVTLLPSTTPSLQQQTVAKRDGAAGSTARGHTASLASGRLAIRARNETRDRSQKCHESQETARKRSFELAQRRRRTLTMKAERALRAVWVDDHSDDDADELAEEAPSQTPAPAPATSLASCSEPRDGRTRRNPTWSRRDNEIARGDGSSREHAT